MLSYIAHSDSDCTSNCISFFPSLPPSSVPPPPGLCAKAVAAAAETARAAQTLGVGEISHPPIRRNLHQPHRAEIKDAVFGSTGLDCKLRRGRDVLKLLLENNEGIKRTPTTKVINDVGNPELGKLGGHHVENTVQLWQGFVSDSNHKAWSYAWEAAAQAAVDNLHKLMHGVQVDLGMSDGC